MRRVKNFYKKALEVSIEVKCSGCSACAAVCPKENCIKIEYNADGFLRPVKDDTVCMVNIRYIGETRIVKTKRTENAVNWHIWKNYGYVLFLIIATDSVKENQDLYDECIHNLRTRLFGVLVHSELGPKTKAHMLVQGLFPVWWAKKDLRNNQAALANDKME